MPNAVSFLGMGSDVLTRRMEASQWGLPSSSYREKGFRRCQPRGEEGYLSLSIIPLPMCPLAVQLQQLEFFVVDPVHQHISDLGLHYQMGRH